MNEILRFSKTGVTIAPLTISVLSGPETESERIPKISTKGQGQYVLFSLREVVTDKGTSVPLG